jgi:hypothetical protein
MSKIKVNWNFGAVRQVEQAVATALEQTAQAVLEDVEKEQVMPKNTGTLSEASTFLYDAESRTGVVAIVSDTPYARRLYYHPEYNFQTSKNKNAGGKWFQPWIDGDKKEFAAKAFAEKLRQNLK